jgi:hypothetical protein
MDYPENLVERDDSFKQELMTSEHVPYSLILMAGLEDVRKGLAFGEDGGLGALRALYVVLPSKIRKQLGELDADVAKFLERKITVRAYYQKKAIRLSPSTRLESNVHTGDLEEVQEDEGRMVHVRVPRYKRREDYVLPIEARRRFVAQTLMNIIDILDESGVLWKTRLELVGGDQ